MDGSVFGVVVKQKNNPTVDHLEIDQIRERYQRRKSVTDDFPKNQTFLTHVVREREERYREILQLKFPDPSSLRMIEIGAGDGKNLSFFNSAGIPWNHIWANELLDDRVAALRESLPQEANVVPGNALAAELPLDFDLVFVSTVFSSILDSKFRKSLANRILEITKPGGLVLYYDFIYDNPRNSDVRGVNRSEIQGLFSNASEIVFRRVTLAPPIGRAIRNWYRVVNCLMPFLRTHIIAQIIK